MIVQELVHLRALLSEVRVSLERERTISSSRFDADDAQPVRPTHLHRRKEAHKRAITF
ncbi:UPF0058 family protein [Natronococcus pandeyae]|uniref:UPF0058 family protein n=1 Tax=Natronococcus pandeyae TaxID=2055836 RepID=UPI0011E8151B|nr:UPF0058 family protein [Natronococcus pandeyae]